MASPRLLQAVLLLSLIPATAYAVATSARPANQPASTSLTSLSITADGTATAIPDITVDLPDQAMIPDKARIPSASQPISASVAVSSTIRVQNSGVIVYNVTSGTLEIGDTTYLIVNGTGIFNQHSLVVVLHATVTSGDTTNMLILIGHTDKSLSTAGSADVEFTSPQSKLAGKFFLDLTESGTLTVG